MTCSKLTGTPARIAAISSLVAVAMLPLGVAIAAQGAPAADGPVAAVFPPWWGADRVFAAAGQAGPVVRWGAADFIVVVQAADRQQLRAAGAWLLLDPAALGGCSAAHPTPQGLTERGSER